MMAPDFSPRNADTTPAAISTRLRGLASSSKNDTTGRLVLLWVSSFFPCFLRRSSASSVERPSLDAASRSISSGSGKLSCVLRPGLAAISVANDMNM